MAITEPWHGTCNICGTYQMHTSHETFVCSHCEHTISPQTYVPFDWSRIGEIMGVDSSTPSDSGETAK